ncbi:24293_t:CDS:2 [Dentiscutata erythropus]|uniref:24293_t:CDS:1 n=1 Tax=Dentiscutata erythropus TaxID=1348616 RepID=A0A9N8V890_9GLOM|nr:24293_t:CDS:2 [Dentiscutata erythropus]
MKPTKDTKNDDSSDDSKENTKKRTTKLTNAQYRNADTKTTTPTKNDDISKAVTTPKAMKNISNKILNGMKDIKRTNQSIDSRIGNSKDNSEKGTRNDTKVTATPKAMKITETAIH